MKLINTLSVLFILFIAVACSSESDSIMNDIDNTNKNEAPAVAEAVAAFNISLTGDAIQTRAEKDDSGQLVEGATEAETKIKSCFIAAVSENQVLSSFEAMDPSSIQMILKVSETYQPKLTFIAVTNVEERTITTLLSQKTLTGIKAVTLTEAPNKLVKVGCKTIESYSVEDQKTDITIKLTQRTAAIELTSITVDGIPVTVTSLELLNVKAETLVEGEKLTEEYISLQNSFTNGAYTKVRFYAYENATQKATALKITYTDNNGAELYRIYDIKTDGVAKVVAGKLYKLTVKISTSKHNVYFDVKDWSMNSINLGDIMPD